LWGKEKKIRKAGRDDSRPHQRKRKGQRGFLDEGGRAKPKEKKRTTRMKKFIKMFWRRWGYYLGGLKKKKKKKKTPRGGDQEGKGER